MGSRPEVSVVIPTRDRRRVLQRALAVSLEQEDVELEVIVVDDGSTDGTPEIVRSIRDSRLRVVIHPRRRGVAAARNAGIADATAERIAFLDDDDIWSPAKLRTQLDALMATGASFVYASAVDVDERGSVTSIDRAPPAHDLLRRLLRQNVIPAGSSNIVSDANLVRDLGGFDERLSQAADWELWIRLAAAGHAASCEEVLVGYSLHSHNMLLADPRRVSGELAHIAAKHRALADALQVSADRSAYYRWIGTGHRRAGRRVTAASAFIRAAMTGGGSRDLFRAMSAFAGQRLTAAADRRGLRSRNEEIEDLARPDWLDRYVPERSNGSATFSAK